MGTLTSRKLGADDSEQALGLLKFRCRRMIIKFLVLPLIKLRDFVLLSDSSWYSKLSIPVSRTDDDQEQPFFILGHPRSGTTLLRQIINRHPILFIPPENGTIRKMIGSFGSSRAREWEVVIDTVLARFAQGYESTHWKIELPIVKQKLLDLDYRQRSLTAIFDVLYREYGEHHANGSVRWGDKSTPGHYYYLSKLNTVFPNAKFIHIVRDGRDCVASCVKTGFYDMSVVKAAYAWIDNVRYCRELGENLGTDRFYTLKYEDLVREPQTETTKICEFLNQKYFPQMLSMNISQTNVSEDVERLAHHANVMKPISPKSIGNWRTQFSEVTINKVNKIIEQELQYYGYQVRD